MCACKVHSPPLHAQHHHHSHLKINVLDNKNTNQARHGSILCSDKTIGWFWQKCPKVVPLTPRYQPRRACGRRPNVSSRLWKSKRSRTAGCSKDQKGHEGRVHSPLFFFKKPRKRNTESGDSFTGPPKLAMHCNLSPLLFHARDSLSTRISANKKAMIQLKRKRRSTQQESCS
ncbi:hypothetical protein CJ030_MR8G006042 [Morella rubra]|uniref:Uncharacterized protein n=1 Tax=Morella rubra TaxID=262757 RepID=A0A6A1UNB6_9ROSI|nr:hypothetical protein CJ030_MR8G006042 [Morella rubra]